MNRANAAVIVVVVGSLFALVVGPSIGRADGFGQCPLVAQGETAQDCPWASLAREMQAVPAPSFETVLENGAPEVLAALRADATAEAFLDAWGQSLNFDELAKGEIVAPAVLSGLYSLAGITRPTEPGHDDWTGVQMAGIEHTYGYLFSLLNTSFGYKRARWVQGEIERGFGFLVPIFNPETTDGTLFANVSYFAGRIAFRDDDAELAALETDGAHAAPSVRSFDYASLHAKRVEEIVTLADGSVVTLRTDLVPFTYPPADLSTADSGLLVYSVARRGDRARLITAFPVAASTDAGLVAPANLGSGKAITTQYNGYVRGLTGTTVTGIRRVVF